MSTSIDDVLRVSGVIGRQGATTFRESKGFRYLVCGTAGLTAIWLLTVLFGSGGTSPAPPPIFTGQATTNQIQQPSTVPVAGPPQALSDPESVKRQQLFDLAFGQTNKEQHAGPRCEAQVALADTLLPIDTEYPSTKTKRDLDAVDVCRLLLKASDARLAALRSAMPAFRAYQTAATASELVAANDKLGSFDTSRHPDEESVASIRLAGAAAELLRESDSRLQRLTASADGAEAEATIDAQASLARAEQALSGFDLPRFTPRQRSLAEVGESLAKAFRESDQRVGNLVELAGAKSLGVGTADKAGLVDAAGALTEVDRKRVTGERLEAVQRSLAAARAAAFPLLETDVAALSPHVPVSLYDRIYRARRVIGDVDRKLLSVEERQALDKSDQIVKLVEQSDARNNAIAPAVQAWETSRSAGAQDQVTAAYELLTSFDRQRRSNAQQNDFQQLELAYYIVKGPSLSLSSATKDKLRLAVVSAGDLPDAERASALEAFKETLEGAGFRIAADRREAAVVVELTSSIQSRTVTTFGPGSIAKVSSRAAWSIDNTEFASVSGLGNGIDPAREGATMTALQRAGQVAAEKFVKIVATEGKP